MPQETRLVTADELFRMPDDSYHRYELVRGRLLTMSPPGSLHGLLVARLTVALAVYVEEQRLGVVLSGEPGFHLERDPDTVRAPDVAFICRARIPGGGVPRGFWSGAPDLAVEVMSPNDRRFEVKEKVADYLSLGVREVWLVEPALRRVTVHRISEEPQVLRESDTLDGGPLLPGFRYSLTRLFSSEIPV
jgi:Uma2 family endonuclease